ncbi:hypothetical protein L6164_035842 [Bauhinia variegata]|uniref:Uncharacterized protein n=1 Tax=Bauhinia variegata TaxID=167791 RepID=A0ACB9KG45_BAUVA|nr:hypothetical protein L6164_035842 [Bauhinia variegata]
MDERMCEPKNFYIWLLQFVALLGLLVLCLWLALRPKSPSYTIVFITIPQASGENSTIFYGLEIENPNKESSIFYDDISLSFLYGQETVGETSISSFHQGTDKTRLVANTVNAKSRTMQSISNAISNATAELKVALATRLRYKTWGIKSKHHHVNLQGILPIGSDGKLSGKKVTLSHNFKKSGRSKVK